MKTMYDYGLSKIYELVINTNPSYAFLLDGNSVLQNTLVAAHVLAHCDFFKHNAYFAPHQPRDGRGGLGQRRPHPPLRVRPRPPARSRSSSTPSSPSRSTSTPHQRLRRERREARRAEPAGPRRPARTTTCSRSAERGARRPAGAPPQRVPPEPEKDLLGFLMEHAPDLEDWQRDVIEIVRNEMLYFVPQMQTKIINEGWASYWHSADRARAGADATGSTSSSRSMHAGVLAPVQARASTPTTSG